MHSCANLFLIAYLYFYQPLHSFHKFTVEFYSIWNSSNQPHTHTQLLTHTCAHTLWRNESDFKKPGVRWPATLKLGPKA